MGYSVYITRANHWLERAKLPIPRADWQAFVDADPTLSALRDLGKFSGFEGATYGCHASTDTDRPVVSAG